MRWTGLVGVVVALAGLGCSDADVSAVAQPVERVFDYSLGPESLDLGQLAVGERATATMEVANNGNTDVLITSVTAPKHPELRFLVGKVALGAGQTLPILVEWEPDTPGRLDGAVRVEIGPSPDELEVVRIPLAGSATGPLLALNVSEHDFGEVPLGCVTELNLTVSNAGNEPMRVDSVTLGGDSALSLQGRCRGMCRPSAAPSSRSSTPRPTPWATSPTWSCPPTPARPTLRSPAAASPSSRPPSSNGSSTASRPR